MSQRIMNRQPTPEGVGAGQTATHKLPLGPTYHAIFFRLSVKVDGVDVNPAAEDMHNFIERVTLKVDGKATYAAPTEILVKNNAYYGNQMRAGVLPLYLDLPFARTTLGEDFGSYATGAGMSSFTIDVKMKSGIVINFLEITTEESFPVMGEGVNAFGWHLELMEFSESFGAAGEQDIGFIPLDPYHIVHLAFDSPSIGDVEVKANNTSIHVSDKEIREQMQYDSGRVKQAGMTHIDFVQKNRIVLLRNTPNGAVFNPEAPSMNLKSFRPKIQWTTAPNAFKAYVLCLKPADQI